MTSYDPLKREFWTSFGQHLASAESPFHDVRLRPPLSLTANEYDLSGTVSDGAKLEAWWCVGKRSMRTQIAIFNPGAIEKFDSLQEHKNSIEDELGSTLDWEDARKNPKKIPQKATYFVRFSTQECDPWDRSKWPAQQSWLARKLRALYDAFAVPGRLPELRLDQMRR